jgi:hypothetical protein
MRRTWLVGALVAFAVLGLTGALANAGDNPNRFTAKLSGFNEVVPIQTNGIGSVRLTVNNNSSISYRETFSGLTSNVTQSHLHFGQRGVNGGVFVFLCTNLGNGPAGTPACPPTGGTVTGTLTAANFITVPAQNVTAGDFQGALRILRAGDAYANVHSANFPAGEIRGQVKSDD